MMANFPGNVRPSPLAILLIAIGTIAMLFYVFHTPSMKSNYRYVSMEELLTASIDLAMKGGNVVKTIRNENHLDQKSKGKTLEGANDPLTAGDTQSHIAIVNGFRKLLPQLNVVSEEHDISAVDVPSPSYKSSVIHDLIKEDQMVLNKDITVWVDPLDATQEYTEDLTQYVTVMVCVAVNGVPTIGVIHKPFVDETYWAWVGHGHSPNLDYPPSNRLLSLPADPKIIVSRSHAGSVVVTAKKSFGEKAEVIPAGGAGFKVLSLFTGTADAYIHTTLIKKWDICAGDALLRAMGGKMTTLHGQDIDYGNKDQPKNEDGLVATLSNHEEYRKKLVEV